MSAVGDAANDPELPNRGSDLKLLARFLNPTDAFILQGRLQAEGLRAVVADAHLVQTYSLLSIAVGGARVLVPECQWTEAREVQAAIERGDYALDEDETTDSP